MILALRASVALGLLDSRDTVRRLRRGVRLTPAEIEALSEVVAFAERLSESQIMEPAK